MAVSKAIELKNAKKQLKFWITKVEKLEIEAFNEYKRNKIIINLAKRGLSTRKISSFLKNEHKINFSHQGVYNIINENIKSI